ncbi:structural protein [Vibrio phage 27Ua.3]|nr:structural protein [Vibrio phage 27Ua.3]
MAFTTGSATSHKDLLSKIRAIATANGWTERRYTQGDATGEDELILSSDGMSGDEYYTAAFRTYTNTGTGAYNIELATAPAYNASAWNEQPSMSGIKVIYCNDLSMKYWLVVNKRRIMGCYQVAGIMEYFYIGKLINYTSLGHWARGSVVAGTGTSKTALWSDQGNGRSGFLHPRENTCEIRQPNDTWAHVNQVYPTSRSAGSLSDIANPYSNGDQWLVQLLGFTSTYNVVGEFEGCRWVPGRGVVLGQLLDDAVGSHKHVVVQDVYRNGHLDHFAMELL